MIDHIELEQDGRVHMIFSVNEKNRRWITHESFLTLKKPLIGSPHIEIHSSLNKIPLEAGSTLKIVISDDINDIVSKLEPLVDKTVNIISSIESITSKVSKDDSDIYEILNNLNNFTKRLAEENSLLTSITGDNNLN